jgi:AcrR family transcriptional regulator
VSVVPQITSAKTVSPLLPDRVTADGTRRRLLEVALVQFAELGYHGVSVRDIAAGVGIKASSVYAHLRSKQELLFELSLLGHLEHRDHLQRALLESGSDPRDQAEHLVAAHVRVHGTYPLLSRVCNRELAALEPDNRTQVEAVRNQSGQMMLDVIRRGSELGVFTIPDPWLATAAIGAIGMRVAEWWNDDLGYRIDDVAATYALFALRMLTDGQTAQTG